MATSDKVKFVEADEYVNGTINPEITEELFAPLGFEFGTPGTYRMTYIWMMINPATWTRFSGPDLIEASRSSLVIVVNPMGEMTVQPKGTGGTTTKSYTFTSDPLAKPALTRLAFLVERKGGSGGHEAAQHLGGAVPKGAWEVMKGTSEAAPVTHPTGRITSALVEARQDSIVKEYESSSFGGDERVSMYLVPPTFPTVTTQKDLRAALDALDAKDKCIADVVEIEVKVPDLIRLRDLPGNGLLDHYTLVGGTDKHVGPPGSTNPDNNHYGEENAIQDLDSVAVTVHQTSWNTSNERPKINDISLPFGGGLDVGGHWGQDLTDPAVGHASHRTGKDFDLNNNSLFDNNETRFRALMCAAGWKFIPVAGAADRHFRYKSCH
ncbi:hypothetical protein HY522_00655 [bacterium]|nr:hypothetical protein [bacterium]